MRIKIKKHVEAPLNVKEVVKRISSTPVQDIASVVRGFVWTYDKGDINHWVPVLDHFDAFLEQHVSTRADVQLKLGEEGTAEDPPFPTDSVLAVLRATCSILENCSNKGAYNSSEHLSILLAAPVLEVSAAALQVLQVLLRKTHHTSMRLAVFPGLTKRLLSLCRGWGGKEEGLDLAVCASADESAVLKVVHKATVLNFEFTPDQDPACTDTGEADAQPVALCVPGVDRFTEPEHVLLAELIKRYKVPAEARLELLCRIRIARNFGTLAGRRQLIRQRLLAFNVLLQCNPSAEEYNSLYVAEPELVSELVGLVQAEDAVEQEELRTLALRALAAQLQDRSRSSSVITAVTAGGQSGLLAMLMHKSVASMLRQANVHLAPSGIGMLPADEVAAVQVEAGTSSALAPAAAAAPGFSSVHYSTAFVDALLALIAALVTSSSGCQALTDAGVISALLPLLRNHHPDHLNLVTTSLKILEMYMDLSQTASTTFRDLGGLSEVIKRLAHEVDAVAGAPGVAAPAATAAGDADVVMATQEQPPSQTASESSSAHPAAVGAQTAIKQLPHSRKSLLKILLRIITISSYQPTGNLSATRPVDDDAQLLYASLKAMYSQAEDFGGTLFSHAVSVMTDLIHHEPQSFRQLQEAGLPDAFLDAIKGGVFPSGDAICAFPGALVALCLNSVGLKRVRETAALNVLIDIFVSKKALRMLTGDTPSVLGSGLEELMRFVPSLRSDGVNVVLGVFKALCILGGDMEEQTDARNPTPAEGPQVHPASATEPAQSASASAEASTVADSPGRSTTTPTAVQLMETDATTGPASVVDRLGAGGAAPAPGAGQPAPAEVVADEMEVDMQQEPAAEQPSAVPQVEPAPAPTAPSAAAPAALSDLEHTRQRLQAEDARLSAMAQRVLAQSLQRVAAMHDLDEDIEAFLPLALTAASRMLEPLLANAETSRLFVERRGADLLLKLYKLPRLTTVFNFSSASHSLLSVFRALSGAHGSAIAAKSKEAVAQQLAQLLPMAEAVGPVCVPTLPADTRDVYVKQVLVAQGLVALTSAVARNVTAMLPQVSMGDPPLLASMGKLERIVMAQAAASDPWKQAKDATKRAAAAAGASSAAAGVAPAPVALDAGPDSGPGVGAAEVAVGLAPASGGGDDDDDDIMEGSAADRVPAEGALAAVDSVASNGKHKRTPEDTSYDALSYLLTSLRTFYMGTAKAIHTPVRRREEAAALPTAPMKAAALNLALVLVGNLRLRPWHHQQTGLGAPSTAGQRASDPDGGSSTSSSTQQQMAAPVSAVGSRSGHFLRVIEELSQVLFDSRRHYCHLLVLNYFSALGGMQVYAAALSDAAVLMWNLLDMQEADKAGQQAASSDQAVADAPQGRVIPAVGVPFAAPEAQATSGAAAPSAAAGFTGTAGTKDPKQIMEALLVKMLVIYEQLANATVLLSAPQATHMLLAALPNYAGQPLVPPAKDALQFVQQLHSHIMCAVLPLWSHPRIAAAPSGVLTAVIRVLQTCCQGPGHASLMLRYSQRPAAARIQAQPDQQMVQQIIEMGFSQSRAEEALRRVGANSVELAMEWLITHPEEPAAPAGQAAGATVAGNAAPDAVMTEEEELTRALLASLSVVGMSPDAVAQRSQQELTTQATTSAAQDVTPVGQERMAATPDVTPVPTGSPDAPAPGGVPAAAAMTSSHDPTPTRAPGSGGESPVLPACSQLVDGALRLISASPATTFSIAELVLTIAQREEGKDREALLERLINDCLPPAADTPTTSAAHPAAHLGAKPHTPARLLLLLLHKDPASRRVAAAKGMVDMCLQVLQTWQLQYTAIIQEYERLDAGKQQHESEVRKLEVPVWIEAVFLLLDLTVTTQPKIATPLAARTTQDAARATPVAATLETPPADESAAATAAIAVRGVRSSHAQQAAVNDVQMAEQPAPAGTAAAAAPQASATAPAVTAGEARGAPSNEMSQLPGLNEVLANWRPCGMLNEQQQERATAIALTLLQQLHKYASRWDKPHLSMFEAEGLLPNPGSATSVVLQLLSHLTRRYNNAQRVLAAGGHKLLLSLPAACLAPSASRQEGHIGAIFRHLLEDPVTLEAWMESEIKSGMSVKGVRDPYPYPRSYNQANPLSRYTTAASFLTMMSSLVSRDPTVFLQAVARTCALETIRGESMVRLKTLREQQQQPAAFVASGDSRNIVAAPSLKPAAVTDEPPATAGTPPATEAAGGGGIAAATMPTAAAVNWNTAAAKSSEVILSKPASRSNRKLVPGNFVEVIDALLDVVLGYKGIKAFPTREEQQQHSGTPESASMEVDIAQAPAGRSAAAAPPAAEPHVADGQETSPMPADLLLRKLNPVVHEVGMQAIVLRLLADYCLLYNNTVGLMLKRDSECGQADGRTALLHYHHHHPAGILQQTPNQEGPEGSRSVLKPKSARHVNASSSSSAGGTGRSSMPGSAPAAHAGHDLHKAGEVLKHIMHVQLVEPPPEGIRASAGVAANASALLQAVCIRSGEGRRRIIQEVVSTLSSGGDQVDKNTQASAAAGRPSPKFPYLLRPGGSEPVKVSAFVGLLGALVHSSSSLGMTRSDPRQPGGSTSMPFELLRAMREAGAPKALARVLTLVDTQHAKAKDAMNAILKPLEVLTRPLPKHLATVDGAVQHELRATLEQAAGQPASNAPVMDPSPQIAHAAERGSTSSGAATARASPAEAEPQAAAGVAGAGGSSSGPGSNGARPAMNEDHRQQAREAAAGPNALAAAGRFVTGGAGQGSRRLPGGLIDHLMEQLVDIEVELGAGGGEGGGGSSDDEGSSGGDNESDGDDHSSSDEDMADGEEHEDGAQGHAAAGVSDEGVMDDAPSLTEGEDDSDDEEAHGDIALGGAGVDAGMGVAALHGPEAHGMDDMDSSEEVRESEDDQEHHHHHHHHFEDDLLPVEDMHMLPPRMQAHHAQDGVVDPLDDEEEEEEEEEDEYLDDDDERSDEEEGRFTLDVTAEEFLNGGARFSWELPMSGEMDNMPTALMMPGTFGRAAARRMLYRPAAAPAVAGVWDDSEAVDATQDPLHGAAAVQMLLSQFGINAAGASSIAMIGPNGRQYRMAVLAPDGADPAVSGRAGAGAVAGAMNGALYSLSMQLMPQQHRLLALPPRLTVSDSAALLESAGAAAPTGSPATEAAAADAALGLRGTAVSVAALTRLLARTPEGAGVTSYLREGARARLATQRQGGIFSVALEQPGMPATLGPAANFLNSLDLLQPGALLSGAPGAGTLADVDNSVWDEAVNQLLEALAPQGLGRARTAAAAPGAARAGLTAEDAAIDPRSLENQMLALLRVHAPPQPPRPEQRQQEAHAAVGGPGEQGHTPHIEPAAGTAASHAAPATAGAAAGPEALNAIQAPAGGRVLTEELFAAAFRAAMHDEPSVTADRGGLVQQQPTVAAAQPQQQAQDQQQQREQTAAAAAISSHPVEVVSSAPDSPTAVVPVDRSISIAADQAAPMDTEEGAPQAAAAELVEPTVAAAAVQGAAPQTAAGNGAAAMNIESGNPAEQEALRQAAEAAEVDLAFLEALPEELRVEVLSARGVELRLPQPIAASPSQTAPAPEAAAAADQDEATVAATRHLAAPGEDHTAAGAAVTPGAAAAPEHAPETAAAPGLPGPSEAAAEGGASIDPEFLAALPDDIRQEVLAQQAAEHRAHVASRAAQQRQQEMGLADLLAAMDEDARADALGQLQDSDLAQLPPMMLAQAQALRERVARQQQALQQQQAAMAAQHAQQHDFMIRRAHLGSGSLGGMMGGAGGRLLMPMGPDGLPLGGSARFGPLSAGLGAGTRNAAGRAQLLEAAGQVVEEPEGLPLLDEADLAILVHLLRASLPLSKVHLQKLLLNLAGHSSTREQLLKELLGLLRSLPGSSKEEIATKDKDKKGTGMMSQLSTSMDLSDNRSGQLSPQQGFSAALDVLGASAVTPVNRAATTAAAEDSSMPTFGPQGKPAIIGRRVLDMLAYLSRHSQPVARQLLHLCVHDSQPALHAGKGKGKSAAATTARADAAAAPRAVEVLLAMLSAPLCQRSLSLLEQLALLLEVVLSTVQRYEADLAAALAAMKEARKRQQEEEQNKKSQEQHTKQEEQRQHTMDVAQAQQQQQQKSSTLSKQQASGAAGPLEQGSEHGKAQGAQLQPHSELTNTLVSIPPGLLKQLPGLLAREALSESAYASIAKVIKLIVEAAPVHLPLMLTMLVDGVTGVATGLLALLDTAAVNGIDADAQLAPAIGTKSGVVLRMLYALQSFQTEVRAACKQQEQQMQQQLGSDAKQTADTAFGGPSLRDHAALASDPGNSNRAAAPSAMSAAGSSAAASLALSLDPVAASAEVDKAVASVANRTSPLWKALSNYILRVEDNLRAVLPQHTQSGGESVGHVAARLLPPGAQQVLPLVEAFFVLCALQGAIPAAPSLGRDLLTTPSADLSMLIGPGATSAVALGCGSSAGRAVNPTPSAVGHITRGASAALDAALIPVDSSISFLKFAEQHRRLLNAYLRRNTSLLESSLAPLLGLPKLIDFDNKRAYFKSKICAQEDRTYAGGLRLAVKRSTVFEDSFNKLRSRTPAEMRGKLSVSFIGEEGIDAGGVSREWYQVMAREIFNPNLALFVSVPEGGTTFQPNPNSVVQSDTGVSHLEFFKFVGKLVGKALYDGQLMDAHFTRSFYKHMLGQPLTYEDIEAVDPEYYKNLKWMLENDITDVLDLTFTAESDFFGKTEIVELIPGGREAKVTESNKHDYVNLIARHRMTTSIKAQIQGFLEGFWQLVPRDLISIFNDHELELLISGLPDIDVADMRANTEYTGYSAGSPVIQWFWQVVSEMDKQDLALLLQFVTGTSKVPLNGFKALQGISGPQRFQIHKSYGTDRLPSAHTCFNQLDLPEYESKEQLAERLAMAIHEGHEGFGFG